MPRFAASWADRGDIESGRELKIAHVEQEVAASGRAAIEFVLDGDAELRGVMAAIETRESRDAAMELAEVHASLQAIDGYRADARAAAIMHGLGFKTTGPRAQGRGVLRRLARAPGDGARAVCTRRSIAAG